MNVKECLENMKKDNRIGVKHFSHSLHTHPGMELKLGVPKDHVIIDGELFKALIVIHGIKLEY